MWRLSELLREMCLKSALFRADGEETTSSVFKLEQFACLVAVTSRLNSAL